MKFKNYRNSWFLTFFGCILMATASQAVTSEVSLGNLEFEGYANYKGCKVNFEVFEGADTARQRLWSGQLKFIPQGVKVGVMNLRTLYTPRVNLGYITGPGYRGGAPVLTDDSLGFTYNHIHNLTEDGILQSNLVTWRLENTGISLNDVIETVNGLRTGNEFPRYKFCGYDWDSNVANCVTFSSRFLEAFGVNLEPCTELKKWIRPEEGGFWSGVRYGAFYTLGFGWARDNMQAPYAIKQIRIGGNNVIWRRGEQRSGPPTFKTTTLRNAYKDGFVKSLGL